MYRRFVKRLLDVVFSLVALLVLSPILLITAILVRVKLGSPVIFRQERPGLNERIFKLYKFRSMTDARDGEGNLLPDIERLSSFGKFLRAASLDELPELVNILKGDMSFIGPRPLLVRYLPLYNTVQRRRHEVRPGLSGLAQVYGRNSLSWDEKFNLDVLYVNHLSILMDLKIFFLTLKTIVSRKGINSDDMTTMEEFKGSKRDINEK